MRTHITVFMVLGMMLAAATAWAAPTITGVSPNAAHILGGTVIYISGTGFVREGTTQVLVGTTPATNVGVFPAGYGNFYIKATVPAGTAGAKGVKVINPDNSNTTATGKFSYIAAPEATSIYPESGAVSGGNRVQIRGVGFTPVGGLHVKFWEADGINCQVDERGTQVTVTSPAGAAGDVFCSVANSDGSSAAKPFEYVSLSLATSTPESGPAMGGTLIGITGYGIAQNPTVLVGGVPATNVAVEGSSRIVCKIPPHALGKVDVQVINPNNDAAGFAQAFEYVSGVKINSLFAGKGPDIGGEIIHISARNVELTGTTQVLFGDVPATNVHVTANGVSSDYNPCMITCTLPPHAPGVVALTIIAPSGYSDTIPAAFTYVPLAENDTRETAQWLVSEGTVDCDTGGATTDGRDASSCGVNDFRDVWYTYTPDVRGMLSIRVTATEILGQPIVSVFQGYDGPEVGCSEKAGSILLDAQPCTDYLIRVAGEYQEAGLYRLELDLEPIDDPSPCDAIRCSANPHFIVEGQPLVLTAPPGFNYRWKKDGDYMEDAPDAITGTHSRYLVFNPVTEADTGIYTCEYDDGAKEVTQTQPYTLAVSPAGSLPVGGAALLAGLVASLGFSGLVLRRRTRR